MTSATATTFPSSAPEVPAVETQSEPTRCLYRFSNGKRCRLPSSQSQSGLCPHHFRLNAAAALPSSPNDSTDLAADLLPELSACSSGVDLRKFLGRLLILMTKGRVSPRRAAVLAYITNQLLHSHRAVRKEEELHNNSRPIFFDVPRPEPDGGTAQ